MRLSRDKAGYKWATYSVRVAASDVLKQLSTYLLTVSKTTIDKNLNFKFLSFSCGQPLISLLSPIIVFLYK